MRDSCASTGGARSRKAASLPLAATIADIAWRLATRDNADAWKLTLAAAREAEIAG